MVRSPITGSDNVSQSAGSESGRKSSQDSKITGEGPEERVRGTLYVVATPIGNLSDMTHRAVEVLRSVDLVACEDTRISRKLFQRWEIYTKVMSLHKFSEVRKTHAVLERLEQGENVALITDAGTPALSDPGSTLVKAVFGSGYRVTPIPGASAITSALSVSGMDASSFVYLGFAPRKNEARERFFHEIMGERRTCIFLESPKRLTDTIRIASRILGDTQMVVMRELTKLHEEMLRGTAAEIHGILETRDSIKGEIVVVVDRSGHSSDEINPEESVKTLMQEGYSGKRLADEARSRYGIRKSDAYGLFLKLKKTT